MRFHDRGRDRPPDRVMLAARAGGRFRRVDMRTALHKKVDKAPAPAGKVVLDGRLNVTRALEYIGP